ncbi:MAG: GxxExxY protein, partial [Kiritimatiellaeota bacterium]|nr:GxxExxY protein [Kiritimatiellota bacterium]
MENDYIYSTECFAIRGALFEVHRNLGTGFTEDIYQSALEMELSERHIPFQAQKEFTVFYKGKPLNKTFRTDIVCYDKIILELKAVQKIAPEHEAQIINYLHVANYKLGFLVNFHEHPIIEPRQYLNPH